MNRHLRSRELGGADPLDTQLGSPSPLLSSSGLARRMPRLYRRAALGLRPGIAPAIVLVPAGFLLGPSVANVLSADVLAHLQVGVSLGLALLGIFVGRALAREIQSLRLILAGNIESAIAVAVVAAATWFVITRSHVPGGADALLVALCLGVTAAASSAHTADADDDAGARTAARIADFDDLTLIVAASVLLVMIRGGYGPVSPGLYVAPVVIGAAVALAGLLLFEYASTESERGLLVLGAVAMLGGASAYLMTSSLAAGLVSGVIWTAVPGRADEILAREAQKLQHPLVALVLVMAGACFVPTLAVLWLLAPYVLFRLVGKIIGATAVAPLVPAVSTPDLTGYLIPPGVIGVGFALTFMVALPPQAGQLVVSVAAAGTVISEIIALFLVPSRGPGRSPEEE